ncbi:replication/maintenance protein RepL [Metaclostridioides mangenotii]|uniref:replication/maintenance protein RepL n=1 Tax=Metaclostridioides mangenotii TaxID=1540 RepID=UPI000A78448F|nr:replication/maintenance protein RepL [Clostridioides mangenotii]
MRIIFNSNKTGKKDLEDHYTESRNVLFEKNKYSNISIKNYLKVVEESYTKKDLIPLMLLSLMDKNNKIYKTLDELSKEFDYPKTTLSTNFTELKKRDFLQRVKNGEYMINPSISYRGSKMDRDRLLDEYNGLKVKKGNDSSNKKAYKGRR